MALFHQILYPFFVVFINVAQCLSTSSAHQYTPTLELVKPQLSETECHRYAKDANLSIEVIGPGQNGTWFTSLATISKKTNRKRMVIALNGMSFCSDMSCCFHLMPKFMIEYDKVTRKSKDLKSNQFTIGSGQMFYLGNVLSSQQHHETQEYLHLFARLPNSRTPNKEVLFRKFQSNQPMPSILLSSTIPYVVFGLVADKKRNETFCIVEVRYRGGLDQSQGAPLPGHSDELPQIEYNLKSQNRCIRASVPITTGVYDHKLDLLVAVSNPKQTILIYRNITNSGMESPSNISKKLTFSEFLSCSPKSTIPWYIYPIAVNLTLLIVLFAITIIVKCMGKEEDRNIDPFGDTKKNDCPIVRRTKSSGSTNPAFESDITGTRSTSVLSVGF